jgi:ABC-type siderophore export system fused ATPase/permease subunit
MAGVAQRTVYAIRKDVEAKFERLPLKFFDSRTHGEILSRAVNDMDSIGSTLQQNLTQLITSVLTLVGVIAMMLTISAVLTIVVALTLPLSLVLVAIIAKRSKVYFMRQQKALGELNGSRGAVGGDLRRPQRPVLRRRVARAVHQRHHHAGDDVRRESRLRVRRGDWRCSRDEALDRDWRRAGVHPVCPTVLDADHPVEQHCQHDSTHDCVG